MSSERAHDPGPTLGEILEGGQDLDRRTKLADGTREKIGAYLDAFDLRDSYGPDETNGSWHIEKILKSGTYAGFVQVVYGQDKVEEFFSNPEKPDVLVGMQVGRQYKLKQDS